jgi:hypothetical protein
VKISRRFFLAMTSATCRKGFRLTPAFYYTERQTLGRGVTLRVAAWSPDGSRDRSFIAARWRAHVVAEILQP